MTWAASLRVNNCLVCTCTAYQPERQDESCYQSSPASGKENRGSENEQIQGNLIQQ